MHRLTLVPCLLILAACSGKAPGEKDVLAEADKLTKPLPGLYRSTTSLVSFELPGADPQTADVMRDHFAQVLPQQRNFCVTPAAAARGFEDMIRQSQQGDCRIDSFVADKSYLKARMSCTFSANLSSTVSVEGTGEPSRSHVDLTIMQTGPSVPGGSETMVMKVDNVRLGGCPK
ncbi:MAG: DUF3617 domain-containing protein [Croceibacterium sp.]